LKVSKDGQLTPWTRLTEKDWWWWLWWRANKDPSYTNTHSLPLLTPHSYFQGWTREINVHVKQWISYSVMHRENMNGSR
jgi:hypothetical protein